MDLRASGDVGFRSHFYGFSFGFRCLAECCNAVLLEMFCGLQKNFIRLSVRMEGGDNDRIVHVLSELFL